MLTVLKYVFYFCLGAFLLFVLIPLGIMFFASPQFYKNSLSEVIHKTTGRQVVIQGRLNWTFYPTVGISASNVDISSPSDFAGGTPFMFIGNLTAGIDFVGLTQRKIQINKLILDNIKLNLVKNTLGQTNWQFNKTDKVNSLSKDQNNQITTTEKNNYQVSSVTLSQIDIKNSEINYLDQQNKKEFKVSNLNLSMNDAAINKTFPLRASFIFSTPKISQPINVNFSANMTVEQTQHQLNLIADNLNAKTNQYQWQGNLEDNLNKKDIASISGRLTVSGSHGSFKGIDLYYYSDLANALIQKTKPTRPDTHETPFNQLQASLNISNGLVNNQNLTILADQMEAKGHGQINLISQNLNYQISLQRLTQGAEPKPRGPTIPLNISGDINSPAIRPDWQGFLVDQLQVQLKEHGEEIGQKIDNAIQQGLQNLIGN
jgi:uncharacterized protein involved in outer membrane biogenesis